MLTDQGIDPRQQRRKQDAAAAIAKHHKVRPLDLLRMWHVRIEVWTLEQAGIKFKPKQPGLQAAGAS